MTQTPAPRRMLIVTPTDFDVMWNNVEHARVRYYRDHGWEVTVLQMKLNSSSRPRDMIRDTLTWRTSERTIDGVRHLSVDPFFNYCAGMRVQADLQGESGAGSGRGRARRLLVRALSPLAVLRDVFWTPCYIGSALRRTRGRFDACISVGPWSALVGRALRRLGRVGVLLYLDRDYDPGLMPNPVRRWYTGVVERRCIPRADAAVSVGFRLQALRRRQTGVETCVIPNGVVWGDYAPAREGERLPSRLGYVGMLTPYSGIEEAIRAMAAIRARHADASLRVVGAGLEPYNAHLRALVRSLGLEGCVELLGSRPHADLPGLLSGCGIGLSNSRPIAYRAYACPLKVMEYMACGMAVIATRDTEAADIVERFGTGVACAFGPEPLGETVAALLDDPERVRRMQASALERGREVDWDALLARESALIEDAISRRAGRGRGREGGRGRGSG